MKQVITTTPPRRPPPPPPKSSPAVSAAPVCPSATPSSQSKTPPRTKVSPKSKASPKLGTASSDGGATPSPGSARARIQTVRTTSQKSTRRRISLNRGNGSKVEGGSRNRLPGSEHSALSRRRRGEAVGGGEIKEDGGGCGGCDGKPDEEREELRRKVVELEGFVKDLKEEVFGLKAELDSAQRLNLDLQAVNGKLSGDLASTEAKIVALNARPDQHPHPQGDKTISREEQEAPPTPLTCEPTRKIRGQCPSPPPPPPPPTPPRLPLRANGPRKPPPVVEFYQSLAKREGNKNIAGISNQYRPVGACVHSSIVGEIQNRSAHLLAIKADVESKGEFINDLIQRVHAAAYSDIEDVSHFVSWLDGQLSTLADERAVLKHFQWPERKADAMREAAIEYRGLKSLEHEISSYSDNVSIPCGVELKKISNLLDKVERGIQRLVKLRNSVMPSYQCYKIPSDWMLDSGIVGEIKQASTKLANLYLRRVITEVQSLQNLDRESTQQALLLQGVHFAYRIHQFAGGLDSETTCAFEEIRQRVPQKLGGSGALQADLPSS